jgi:hypothetical protein
MARVVNAKQSLSYADAKGRVGTLHSIRLVLAPPPPGWSAGRRVVMHACVAASGCRDSIVVHVVMQSQTSRRSRTLIGRQCWTAVSAGQHRGAHRDAVADIATRSQTPSDQRLSVQSGAAARFRDLRHSACVIACRRLSDQSLGEECSEWRRCLLRVSDGNHDTDGPGCH